MGGAAQTAALVSSRTTGCRPPSPLQVAAAAFTEAFRGTVDHHRRGATMTYRPRARTQRGRGQSASEGIPWHGDPGRLLL